MWLGHCTSHARRPGPGQRGLATRTIAVEPIVHPRRDRASRTETCCGRCARFADPRSQRRSRICSQVLHHFDDRRARILIAELDRVSRVGVVMVSSSASRSSGPLPCGRPRAALSPSDSKDGLLSSSAGSSGPELRALVSSTVPRDVVVRGTSRSLTAAGLSTNVPAVSPSPSTVASPRAPYHWARSPCARDGNGGSAMVRTACGCFDLARTSRRPAYRITIVSFAFANARATAADWWRWPRTAIRQFTGRLVAVGDERGRSHTIHPLPRRGITKGYVEWQFGGATSLRGAHRARWDGPACR